MYVPSTWTWGARFVPRVDRCPTPKTKYDSVVAPLVLSISGGFDHFETGPFLMSELARVIGRVYGLQPEPEDALGFFGFSQKKHILRYCTQTYAELAQLAAV